MVGFPLLLIPLAVYNIIVFLMPGVSFADPVVKLTLMSGAEWSVTLSDILLALGIVLLLFEIIKGARPGAKYITDHLLSLIVFGAAAAEFLLWPKFGNSTYCLLATLALMDFLSGIALRARRGTGATTATPASRRRAGQAEVEAEGAKPPAAESQFEPASAPASAPPTASSVPAAASVAESVLLDRPEPSLAQPAVPSPGLQPGGSPTPDTPQR
ncbi:MAG: hypothetical protein ACJ8EE_14100 [Bradyrhizobium sp.]